MIAVTGILGPDGRPVNAERVKLEKATRFNPIANWTPDVLTRQLVAYARGEISSLAYTMEWLEQHDEVIQTVAPKAKAAVSRHDYDILIKDSLRPEQESLAEEQQGRLQEFYASLTASDAVELEESGGMRLLVQQIMDAYGKGYAAHHIVWQPSANGLTAELIKVPTWFFEIKTGRMQYLLSPWDIDGIPLDQLGGRDAWMTIKGRGVMLAGAIARMFKQLPLQDWLTYCDRHGMPAFVGHTTAQKGSEGWLEMVRAVAGIGSEYGAVINKDDIIDVLDLKGQGELPYEKLVDRMDRAQVMLWRGGDLSTISRTSGVGANPQEDEAAELDGDNARWVSEVLNKNLTRYVLRYYYGPNVPILAEIRLRVASRDNVTQDLAVAQAFQAAGERLDAAWMASKFNMVLADDSERSWGEHPGQPPQGGPQSGPGGQPQDTPPSPITPIAKPTAIAPINTTAEDEAAAQLQDLRSILAVNLQPLGDALWQAYQGKDVAAVQAALKKISAGMPDIAENVDDLADWLGTQMAEALAGDEPGVSNAARHNPQAKGKDGKFTSGGSSGESSKDETPANYTSTPVKDWKPDAALPKITPAEGRAILAKGKNVSDPLGHVVRFDATTEQHWNGSAKGGPKEKGDIDRRLSTLPEAMRTVEHPHEVWKDGNERIYLRRYGHNEGMTAFVGVEGNAITYHPEDHYSKLQAKINKLRKQPENHLFSRTKK